MCYEHSPAEGIVLVQMIETALQSMEKYHDQVEPRQRVANEDDLPEGFTPRRLTWKIDGQLRRMIEQAKIHMDRYQSVKRITLQIEHSFSFVDPDNQRIKRCLFFNQIGESGAKCRAG